MESPKGVVPLFLVPTFMCAVITNDQLRIGAYRLDPLPLEAKDAEAFAH
ncbi:MAG: hypothetical protein KME08_04225 [Aphanothece sp. CMT-3BRIN-NPC111]|nr:hypothetical protein [Aphanothece sp. CMT-3BRIN-NPC111]